MNKEELLKKDERLRLEAYAVSQMLDLVKDHPIMRENLLGRLSMLKEEIESIREEVEKIKLEVSSGVISALFNSSKSNVPVRWYSIEDCATAWGLQKSYFHRFRHLLPNFGVFDDPVHKRFSEQSFMEWVKVPLCEWEQRWKEMTPSERRMIDAKHAEKHRRRQEE